jgi:pimeloyl-ACP methyl ester carboxylesterase
LKHNIYGQGQPVVLLHGFAEFGNVWQYQIDFLKDYCQVIVPEWADEKVDMSSIETIADAIANFISTTINKPVILIGHSMGGYITLALVEKNPTIIKTFGFVHSTAFADSDEKKATRLKSIDLIKNSGTEAYLRGSVPNLFGETYKRNNETKLENFVDDVKQLSPKIMMDCTLAMMQRPDRTSVLRSSKKPVMFILGTEDKAVPMADVMRQVYQPETAYFRLLEGVGHMGMWEAPEEVNQFILKFIQDIG